MPTATMVSLIRIRREAGVMEEQRKKGICYDGLADGLAA